MTTPLKRSSGETRTRNATQDPKATRAGQTDPWQRLSQPTAALDGGQPSAPPAQSFALRAPPGSQQKKRRHPQEKHNKNRGPREKTAARGSAGKDPTTVWRRAAPIKRARKPHRPDDLIVETNGKTFSEVIAMATRRDDGKTVVISDLDPSAK